jgi:hypothetical protein
MHVEYVWNGMEWNGIACLLKRLFPLDSVLVRIKSILYIVVIVK